MGYVIGQDNVSNGGASAWGDITGTVANQTDLQSELDGKVDVDGAKVLSANDFTDVLKSKLDNIEANADVTDATNVDSAGAVMNTDTSTASMSFVVDEDDMTSDSATKVPTQQSVKAYVDANAGGGGGTVQDATTKAIKVATEVGTTGNARGTNAVDLQVTRSSATQVASGSESFTAGKNNTASDDSSIALGLNCTASNQGAVALNAYSTASGSHSLATGSSTASGDTSTAMGSSCTASGINSFAVGSVNTASERYTVATGSQSVASQRGQFAHAGDRISTSGDSQYSRFVLREQTSDATATEMSISSETALIRMVLPSDKAWRYNIDLIGVESATGDVYSITHVGTIKRDGSTTSLVGTDTTQNEKSDAGASGWSSAVTADDTNESLKIEVTGEASHTINWCATVHLTEVGF